MYDEGFSTLVTTGGAEDIRRPVRKREEEEDGRRGRDFLGRI